MLTYNYKGIVEEIGETKAFGNNGFTKRELVVGNDVDSQSKYPNPVCFTFKKDKCGLCDAVKKGDRVNVQFTIDGRRWDGGANGVRYFVDLTGWKIEKINDNGTTTEPEATPPDLPADFPADAPTDVEDLPF